MSLVQPKDIDQRFLTFVILGGSQIVQAAFQPRWKVSAIALLAHSMGLYLYRETYCFVHIIYCVAVGVFMLYIVDPQRHHEKWETIIRDREREKQARLETEAENRKLEEQRRLMYRNVLHDFKQPVQMADMVVQMLPKNEPMAKQLDRIVSIFRLLLDNLAIAKQLDSTTEPPPTSTTVDVVHVVEQTVLTLRSAHPHLTVGCVFAQHVSRIILTDEHILSRALWNLTGNAVKYMPPTGGRIDILVDVEEAASMAATPSMLRIRVSDTGVGIPPHRASELFGEYAQLDQGVVGGQGLGLYTSRASLRRIGGDLTFAPNVPRGASFQMTIPYRPAAPLAPAVDVVVVGDTANKDTDNNTESPKKKHILVVDDDNMMRWMYTTLVAKLGFDVTAARDGMEALALLQTTTFDAMITDMNMPSAGDGMVLMRACRSQLHLDIPMAVLSGSSAEASVEDECERLGARYFQKGSQKNIIEHILHQLCRKDAASAPPAKGPAKIVPERH